MPDSKSGATAMYPASATSSASSCTQSVMPKISWITSTTGVLLFDSGYTTNVSTERPSCLTVTHSRCRGDFSSLDLAQSCAETACAVSKRRTNAMYFMVVLPLNGKARIYHREREPCAKCKKESDLTGFELGMRRRGNADIPPPCFAKRVRKRLK